MSYLLIPNSAVKGRSTVAPSVTISRYGGKVMLNKAITQDVVQMKYRAALFLFDKRAKRIAIRLVRKEDPRTYRLTFAGNRVTWISARNFLKYIGAYGLPTHAFYASWDKKSLIEVALSKKWLNGEIK